MASQRVTLIKVGGVAAGAVAERFDRWIAARRGDKFPIAVRREVDRFAETLRANAHLPPIVYYSEWIDLWSMGDLLPGLGVEGAHVVDGERFQACCHTFPITVVATTIGRTLSDESKWLKARVREAEAAWKPLVTDSVLIVLRDVTGGLVMDSELSESLLSVPPWLADTRKRK